MNAPSVAMSLMRREKVRNGKTFPLTGSVRIAALERTSSRSFDFAIIADRRVLGMLVR